MATSKTPANQQKQETAAKDSATQKSNPSKDRLERARVVHREKMKTERERLRQFQEHTALEVEKAQAVLDRKKQLEAVTLAEKQEKAAAKTVRKEQAEQAKKVASEEKERESAEREIEREAEKAQKAEEKARQQEAVTTAISAKQGEIENVAGQLKKPLYANSLEKIAAALGVSTATENGNKRDESAIRKEIAAKARELRGFDKVEGISFSQKRAAKREPIEESYRTLLEIEQTMDAGYSRSKRFEEYQLKHKASDLLLNPTGHTFSETKTNTEIIQAIHQLNEVFTGNTNIANLPTEKLQEIAGELGIDPANKEPGQLRQLIENKIDDVRQAVGALTKKDLEQNPELKAARDALMGAAAIKNFDHIFAGEGTKAYRSQQAEQFVKNNPDKIKELAALDPKTASISEVAKLLGLDAAKYEGNSVELRKLIAAESKALLATLKNLPKELREQSPNREAIAHLEQIHNTFKSKWFSSTYKNHVKSRLAQLEETVSKLKAAKSPMDAAIALGIVKDKAEASQISAQELQAKVAAKIELLQQESLLFKGDEKLGKQAQALNDALAAQKAKYAKQTAAPIEGAEAISSAKIKEKMPNAPIDESLSHYEIKVGNESLFISRATDGSVGFVATDYNADVIAKAAEVLAKNHDKSKPVTLMDFGKTGAIPPEHRAAIIDALQKKGITVNSQIAASDLPQSLAKIQGAESRVLALPDNSKVYLAKANKTLHVAIEKGPLTEKAMIEIFKHAQKNGIENIVVPEEMLEAMKQYQQQHAELANINLKTVEEQQVNQATQAARSLQTQSQLDIQQAARAQRTGVPPREDQGPALAPPKERYKKTTVDHTQLEKDSFLEKAVRSAAGQAKRGKPDSQVEKVEEVVRDDVKFHAITTKNGGQRYVIENPNEESIKALVAHLKENPGSGPVTLTGKDNPSYIKDPKLRRLFIELMNKDPKLEVVDKEPGLTKQGAPAAVPEARANSL